jgi:hypothetical protein
MTSKDMATISVSEAAVAAMEALAKPGAFVPDPPVDQLHPGFFLIKVDPEVMARLIEGRADGETYSDTILRLCGRPK